MYCKKKLLCCSIFFRLTYPVPLFLFLFPFLRGRTIWFSIQERNFEPNIIRATTQPNWNAVWKWNKCKKWNLNSISNFHVRCVVWGSFILLSVFYLKSSIKYSLFYNDEDGGKPSFRCLVWCAIVRTDPSFRFLYLF